MGSRRGCLRKRFDRLLICEIANGDERTTAEIRFHLFQSFGACAGKHHRGTLRMQRLGDGPANPAGSPGDECDFAGEIEHHNVFAKASISAGVSSVTV